MPNSCAFHLRLWVQGVAAVALAGASVVAPAAATTWPALHFSTGTSFNHTLAVADLDGDGKLDVATPNSQLSAVTVLLGHGDGTLAAFQSYPTFAEPQDVQIADVTGDGVPDLVTPDYVGGGVTLLRGLGDGTFAPRVGYPIGPGLISLAVVDLDGDARLDLAVSKESGSKVAVLPALVGGGFGAAIEVASGAIPHQIAAADLDHDSLPDLAVVSNGAASISVHLGTGTHTPGIAMPHAAGAAPVGLTLADLDGDGDPDLVSSNVHAATVSVMLGQGDGTFAAPVAYPTAPRPRGMDAGDLDGDGVPELVVATGYPDGDSVLTVYRGVGDGTLAALPAIRLPYRAADCVLADMNGDGRRDIVATGPNAGVVSVLLNPGGTLAVMPSPPGGTLALALHPNPMREAVSFRIRAPEGATLEILDLAGRRVASLGAFESGERVVRWGGERAGGGRVPPGIYLARLAAGGDRLTRRVVILPR